MSVDLKKMLAVLDEQIALLEQRHAEKITAYTAIPSANQWYFYVPNLGTGLVNVEQDAAFVLLRMNIPADWSGLQLVDANTGRNYLSATRRVPAARSLVTPIVTAFPADVQPSAVGMATPFQAATLDYHYVLDSAVTIPRGGVVRIVPQYVVNALATGTTEPTPTSAVFRNPANNSSSFPVLMGYKVFGG